MTNESKPRVLREAEAIAAASTAALPTWSADEHLLFDTITQSADCWYTASTLAQGTSLPAAVVAATLQRFVELGIMEVVPPEKSAEEETVFVTRYTYLTFEALKHGDGSTIEKMAEAGDKRASRVLEEWEAEFAALPVLEKAQRVLCVAHSMMHDLSRGPNCYSELERVHDYVLEVHDYLDQALEELDQMPIELNRAPIKLHG